MKFYVELTNKETEMTKDIAMELGAGEKNVELATKSTEFIYGPVHFKSENGICEIELGEKLTTFILDKVKGMCKYLKGLFTALIGMIDGIDDVFEDEDEPIFTIEGKDGNEFRREFLKDNEVE